jgi:hypothetical protein
MHKKESMFEHLIEASKQQMEKGAYQLSFDESTEFVKVINKKNGDKSYVVKGDHDEMLIATLDYFGLRKKK